MVVKKFPEYPEQREDFLYRIYGITLRTGFRFSTYLPKGDGLPTVTFHRTLSSPMPGGPPAWPAGSNGDAALASGGFHPLPKPARDRFLLFRHSDFDILRFKDAADFYLWKERIICHLTNPVFAGRDELFLLGTVLSLWLEKQGIPALHASAVVVEGKTIVFLGNKGNGKSSLAAAFMQQGYPLLTDDILPVEHAAGGFLGRPGYPQMRMWGNEADYFLGGSENLEIVHPVYPKFRVPVGAGGFGIFSDMPQTIDCFYLPVRRDAQGNAEIEIDPVSPAEAVIELLRHSFVSHFIEALGLQAQRLFLLSGLARRVPMRRIAYPSGFERLPAVRRAILEDIGVEDKTELTGLTGFTGLTGRRDGRTE